MEYAVALATPADSWKAVRRAEDLGYGCAWFFDTQLLGADVFTAMGAAATQTERIHLATGVLIPSNRIAPVAANAYATLNALAPGRIRAGIGTGFTGRLTMGLGPYKLADMGDYIRVMQGMWHGETVEALLEGRPRKVRFLNPERGLINIRDPIPVYISAFGPKARRLAAELGAHWINVDLSEGFAAAAAAAEEMNGLYRAAGFDPATRRKTVFVWGSVLRDGETCDSARVKAECGPFAVQVLHAVMEAQDRGATAGVGSDDAVRDDALIPRLAREYRKLYETYGPTDARYLALHRGHLLFVRPDEAQFATGELIQATTITGTPEQLRSRIRTLQQAGYDEVVVAVTPGCENMIDDWMGVFRSL